MRWDRTFRALLIGVLLLVGWIGLRGGVSLVRAHAQAEHELHMVSSLVQQNRQLSQQARALHDPQTIMRDARALGMVRANEQPFVVTGLSGN